MKLLVMLHVAIAGTIASSSGTSASNDAGGIDSFSQDPDGVAEAVAQVVEGHVGSCQLVFVTNPSYNGPVSLSVIRRLSQTYQGTMIIEARSSTQPSLRKLELGNPTRPCLALLMVFQVFSVFAETIAPFLQDIKLYLCPDCRIILVGPKPSVEKTLLHKVFRNTKHALYLGPVSSPDRTRCQIGDKTCGSKLQGFSRCLYCSAGEAGVKNLGIWNAGKEFLGHPVVFSDTLEDMNGHRIRVVAKELFPFVEFQPHSNASATTVSPKDSLDVRMLNTIASMLNFTYEMRMAWDDQWGTFNDGVWTGMVGTLEMERADFSLMLFWSDARLRVIDFTRIYAYEPFVMITHKPRPLPQHLALVRPFQPELWLSILVATFFMAIILWAIQKAWASFSGGRSFKLDTAFLYSWAILLEDPPTRLPANITGQTLIGWWWVFCFLITAIYRSYLIAHLSVPITPPPIDHLDQLLARPGSTWGIEPGFGLGWDWFKLNTNPRVQDMFKKLEVLNIQDQLDRVLKGRHAFFTWKYYIKTIIASRYTNRYGSTPIHLGRQEFIPGSCGWGVRKGAPFLSAMDRLKDRLLEAGLIDYWLYKLFDSKMKKERKERLSQKIGGDDTYVVEANTGGIVLNLNHLQGAFYLLFLGYVSGLITVVMEGIIYKYFGHNRK